MFFALRIPSKFFSDVLDMPMLFITIHTLSVVIGHTIISLLQNGEFYKAIKLFCIALYSMAVGIFLLYFYPDCLYFFHTLI